ncbi:MAG: hypothetical protein F6K10_09565 [Moorea sp. SIO2B7]|nr:hypothetical protein [Moorena sp. SIO2B7]
MSNNQNSRVWGIVITGVFGLLSTSVSLLLKGYWDIKLKEKEFHLQLIMNALESSNPKERQNSLEFFVDTNIIHDKKIKEGLRNYYSSKNGEEPKTPPQLTTTR